ncbi:MAG: hypothetical protein ACJ8R9_10895 [Steroidobacteraceae bacterium]
MKEINIESSVANSAAAWEWSDYVDSIVATGSSQAVTVPANATRVAFAATGNFYVKFSNGGTAAIPGASVTDGTASILNPTSRRLAGLTSFAVIAAAGVVINLSWHNK